MDALFIIAVGVFLITFCFIVIEKVHRTVAALSGSMLMILLGVLSQERAIEGVDFNTLGLLIGMMVIVSIARHSGMFQYVAIWAARVGRGKPIPIFFLLASITALFSAFLDNVTTVLLIVPVVFVIAHNLKVHPMPFLISTILFSNIGGTATLIGDPPNILIGSAAGLSFNAFLMQLGPAVAMISVAAGGMLWVQYRRKLVATPEAAAHIMSFRPEEAISDRPLLVRSLFVLGLVLIGFFTHTATHLEGATIALSGAALLLLLTMRDPEAHLHDVEWTTIFFFIGLFVVVAGLEEVGAIRILAHGFLSITHGDPLATAMTILWSSAIFSAIIDNIPFVATMIPLVKDIGALTGIALGPLWWALALGADLGGNFTIVGASANVVVKGMAERDGYHIGFMDYLKAAAPVTFVSILIATGYIWLRYF